MGGFAGQERVRPLWRFAAPSGALRPSSGLRGSSMPGPPSAGTDRHAWLQCSLKNSNHDRWRRGVPPSEWPAAGAGALYSRPLVLARPLSSVAAQLNGNQGGRRRRGRCPNLGCPRNGKRRRTAKSAALTAWNMTPTGSRQRLREGPTSASPARIPADRGVRRRKAQGVRTAPHTISRNLRGGRSPGPCGAARRHSSPEFPCQLPFPHARSLRSRHAAHEPAGHRLVRRRGAGRP